MKILVTGSKGFVGKNLIYKLKENKNHTFLEYVKGDDLINLEEKLDKSDFLIHLAGENRPKNAKQFKLNNIDLTKNICNILQKIDKKIPIIFTSSIQAENNSPYGESKKKAENILYELYERSNNPVKIYRLPGVFGKWCKPQYNSVVATFCYLITRNKEITISDPNKKIKLIFIDDLVQELYNSISNTQNSFSFGSVDPMYEITLGELAKNLKQFSKSRVELKIENVGTGFQRKLYSTYLSYLPFSNCSYKIPVHKDQRGIFVEMLKTKNAGQFSYFTSGPGITRGGHYHHTKSEKFLVIKGKARFKFYNLQNGEKEEIFTNDKEPTIVDTIPGWSHDIKNVGKEDLIVMLWANEIFDKEKPDTFNHEV